MSAEGWVPKQCKSDWRDVWNTIWALLVLSISSLLWFTFLTFFLSLCGSLNIFQLWGGLSPIDEVQHRWGLQVGTHRTGKRGDMMLVPGIRRNKTCDAPFPRRLCYGGNFRVCRASLVCVWGCDKFNSQQMSEGFNLTHQRGFFCLFFSHRTIWEAKASCQKSENLIERRLRCLCSYFKQGNTLFSSDITDFSWQTTAFLIGHHT